MIEMFISAIAIILSVVSIVLGVFREGIILTLRFRESELTSAKRKAIEKVLTLEREKQLLILMAQISSKKSMKDLKDDEQITKSIIDLASIERYRTFGNELLEKMTRYAILFLRGIVSSLLISIATVLYFVVYVGFVPDIYYFSIGLIFCIASLAVIFGTYRRVRDYYFLREAFLKLSEKPTFNNCGLIDEYLEEKGIFI